MTGERRIRRRGPDDRNWYVVAAIGGEARAAIVTGLLESAGIPVWTYRESAGVAIGLTVGVLGTVTIMVPESYYEEAMALLEADESRLLEEGDDADIILTDDDTIPPEA